MNGHDCDETAEPAPIRLFISRRRLIQGASAALAASLPAAGGIGALARPVARQGAFDFVSLPLEVIDTLAVASGYEAQTLIRWGDPLTADGPAFEPGNLSAASQRLQFGFNCDYVAFVPAPHAKGEPERAALVVNHEYAAVREMYAAGLPVPEISAATVALEQEAVGLSIVGLVKVAGRWQHDPASPISRRISATTPMLVAGPAGGDVRLQTGEDPSGLKVRGTFANCAGGKTPWGTVLSAEENFHFYFVGAIPEGHRETDSLVVAQAGLNASEQAAQAAGAASMRAAWGAFEARFDVSAEPREPNRFGWIVEVDPFRPEVPPVKRTALGRFRHEAATPVVNADGRVVVYLGEDRAWGFVYRFVSHGRFDPAAGARNGGLLDHGTLSVARFDDTGVDWIPLEFGLNGLTAQNGFFSPADVLIDARRAAQLAGGTPMDRPEDIDVSPLTGRVFVNLTRNNDRKDVHVDGANPRPENEDGHILELVPPKVGGGVDHSAERFEWSVFLLAGPVDEGGRYGDDVSTPLSGPDNLAFDPQGRLWIATDNRRWAWRKPLPNGLFACAAQGVGKASPRLFLNVPRGAEATGPEFAPDGETLFLAVQHPGEDVEPKPEKVWPDFEQGVPGRPSVIMVTRRGGGPVGGRASR